MAPPNPIWRTPPTGWKMPDGFKTTIAFAIIPDLQIWEITVQPPGYDGGEPINTTTMLNNYWRTQRARQLKTLSPTKVTGAYDPDVMDAAHMMAAVNHETTVSVHFPDNSILSFYGYIQKAEIKEHKEGEQPEIELTVIPTNWDPTNSVEEPPVFNNAAHT